jgi:CubicO group peptidase (beta-lactamase class C family)
MSSRTTIAMTAALIVGGFGPAAVDHALAQPGPPAEQTVADAFDGTMRAWMREHRISRASVAVMRHRRLVHAQGFGGRGAIDRVPVWSLSKAITASCIAVLTQEGKLGLDDPIGPLVAKLAARTRRSLAPAARQITVAQLILHRSGLPRVTEGNKFAPGMSAALRQHGLAQASIEHLLPSILETVPVREPGTAFEYTNIGYLLLGQIIEAVSGEPYVEACARRVLRPAGIVAPGLDPQWGRLAHSAAGWRLSGPEYLAFVRQLLPEPAGLLSTETWRWMQDVEGRWTDAAQRTAYSLGVNLFVLGRDRYNMSHGGGWHWVQSDAAGGTIRQDKRGTLFVATADGVAWFASFDGVVGDLDPVPVRQLGEALSRARHSISRWPAHDLFRQMRITVPEAGRQPQ